MSVAIILIFTKAFLRAFSNYTAEPQLKPPSYCLPVNVLKPSNTEDTFKKHKDAEIFEIHLNPVILAFNWIALAEHFQMSTHVPGFQSLFLFFASFCIGQISHQQQYLGFLRLFFRFPLQIITQT